MTMDETEIGKRQRLRNFHESKVLHVVMLLAASKEWTVRPLSHNGNGEGNIRFDKEAMAKRLTMIRGISAYMYTYWNKSMAGLQEGSEEMDYQTVQVEKEVIAETQLLPKKMLISGTTITAIGEVNMDSGIDQRMYTTVDGLSDVVSKGRLHEQGDSGQLVRIIHSKCFQSIIASVHHGETSTNIDKHTKHRIIRSKGDFYQQVGHRI